MTTNYLEELKDPYKVQSLLSEYIRDKSNIKITDVNAPITILMDSVSHLYTNMSDKIDNLENRLYMKNINRLNDIYKYLENEELSDLYGKPSKFNFFLLINIRDLIDRIEATGVTDNIIEIKIPKGMEITISGFDNVVFSNYHELILKINKVTLNHWLTYADSEIQIEPFLINRDDTQLNSVMLEYNTIKYLRITFPLYQFQRSEYEQGINNKINVSFENQLMGMEFFKYSTILDGIYHNVEKINLVHEDANYDINRLTGKFRYLNENSIEVSIPIIYRSNGLITDNDQVKLLVYTTRGEKGNITIPIEEDNQSSSIRVTFNLLRNQRKYYDKDINFIGENSEIDRYTILDNNFRFIKGGESRKPFNIIKENVINNYSKNEIPINENELKLYLKNKGFNLDIYKETITNKIYIAHREMKLDNLTLPTYNTLSIIINPNQITSLNDISIDNSLDPNYKNITHGVYKKGNIITITPDTIWEVNEEENTANIIPRGNLIENRKFNNTQVKLNELNERNLMFFPFNININLDRIYPTCEVFNFNDPKIENSKQTDKNLNIEPNLLVESFRINKISYRYKDYFRLEFVIINEDSNITIDTTAFDGNVSGTENTTSLNINELLPVLTFRNNKNNLIYKTGKFLRMEEVEGSLFTNYIFSIDLETDYITDILSEEQHINIKAKSNINKNLHDQFIKINQDVNLTILRQKNIEEVDNLSLNHIPEDYKQFIRIINFQFNIKFGDDITGFFENDFNVVKEVNQDNYLRYSETQYASLSSDEYKKDNLGTVICVRDDNDEVIFAHDVFRNSSGDSFLVFDDILHTEPRLSSDPNDIEEYDELNPRHIKLSNMLTSEDIIEKEVEDDDGNMVMRKEIKDEVKLYYNTHTSDQTNGIVKGELQKRKNTYIFNTSGKKVILNEYGYPIEKGEYIRAPLTGVVLKDGMTDNFLNKFQLNMYLFDYKLKYVNNINLDKYIVNNVLLNMNELNEIREYLLYRTSIYYNPTNIRGISKYILNSNIENEEYIDKNFKIDVDVHLLESIYNRSENVNFIERTIYDVIYKNINNKILSVFDIITGIKNEISEDIVKNFNIKTLIRNRPGIYLLEKVNEEDTNYVNSILKLIDGNVILSPDIEISWIIV